MRSSAGRDARAPSRASSGRRHMKPSSSHPATPNRSSHAARAACLVPRPGSLQAARCAHRTRGSSARLAVPRREPEAHLRGSCGPPSCTAQAPALQRTGQAGSAAAPRRARIHSSAHQVNAHAHRCRVGPPHLAPGRVQRRTPACPTHSQRTTVAMAFLILPQQVSRHQHVPLMHSAPPSRWASSSCPSRSPEEDTSMSQSSSSPVSPVLCWACRSPVDSAPLGCIAARLGALGETCTTVLCGGSTSKPQSPRLLHAGTARYQARCQARCNYLEKVSGGAFT